MQRTDWAEDFVEIFSSRPLTAECIFHSPKYIDRGLEKEVCDLLIILRGKAILISMKAQEDPFSKNSDKLKQWTTKNAMNAFNQAKGALKTIATKSYWCHHSRRGKVEFKPGEIQVTNVIVLTELFNEVVELCANSPMQLDNIPVTYLSLNDFLNLIKELRTFPDISAYFVARRKLPMQFLLMIGNEVSRYQFYIQNFESFNDWNIKTVVVNPDIVQNSKWQVIQNSRLIKQKNANLIEYVSDALATRNENFSDGLESHIIGRFDKSNDRRNYLLMQEELCDLGFNERAALGEQFNKVIDKVKCDNSLESMIYASFYTDSKPDFVYVLISARGVDRNNLINRSLTLLHSAMLTYKKCKGLVIADRDGEGFEVELLTCKIPPSAIGEFNTSYFDHLKVSDIPV